MPTALHSVRSSGGLTMVEVMLVMAVFVIGILSVGQLQTRAVISNTAARKSTHASTLATDQMEKLICLGYGAPELLDRSADGVGGLDNDRSGAADGCNNHPPYTVCWNVAQIPATPAPESINYKRVRVIVTWGDRGIKRRHLLDTIKTDN